MHWPNTVSNHVCFYLFCSASLQEVALSMLTYYGTQLAPEADASQNPLARFVSPCPLVGGATSMGIILARCTINMLPFVCLKCYPQPLSSALQLKHQGKCQHNEHGCPYRIRIQQELRASRRSQQELHDSAQQKLEDRLSITPLLSVGL